MQQFIKKMKSCGFMCIHNQKFLNHYFFYKNAIRQFSHNSFEGIIKKGRKILPHGGRKGKIFYNFLQFS